MKSVLVHSCFSAITPFTVGIGTTTSQQIFHENPNVSCNCKFHVTYRERDAKLSNGEAYVVALRVANGWRIEWREIVLARKTKGPPWIQMPPPDSFVTTERQRQVIETYGAMTQMVFAELGAALRGTSSRVG